KNYLVLFTSKNSKRKLQQNYIYFDLFFCFFIYLYSKIFVNFSIKKYSKSKPTKRQKIVLIKH
ncbi:hypothetical protein DPC64_08060, partial [Campylobacter jejuni]|nr:hypothetical protein [Campylobacter jejuni]EAL4816044.1 hypothetical protein [Campylobacter jejuni]